MLHVSHHAARMSSVESYFSFMAAECTGSLMGKIRRTSGQISLRPYRCFGSPHGWWKVNTWDLLFQGKSRFGDNLAQITWLFSPGWNSFLPSRNPWTQRKFTNDRGRWRVLLYLLPAIRLQRSFAGASSTSHTFASSNFSANDPHLWSKRHMRDLDGFPHLGELDTWRKKIIISCKSTKHIQTPCSGIRKKEPLISNSNDHFWRKHSLSSCVCGNIQVKVGHFNI